MAEEEKSIFFPDDSHKLWSFGDTRTYQRLSSNSSGFLRQLFIVNIVFWAAFLIYFVLTASQPFAAQPLLLAVLLLPSIFLSLYVLVALRSAERKRLKLRASGFIIYAPLSQDVFNEHCIDFDQVRSLRLALHKRHFLPEEECLIIERRDGRSLVIPFEEVLTDIRRSDFMARLSAYRPGLLDLSEAPALPGEGGPSFTELWLHDFATQGTRESLGLLPAGASLKEGSYTVDGIIGGGGQGNAYLAEGPNGTVVLKEYVLPVYRGTRLFEDLSARFFAEAKLLSALDHRAIVKLLDHFVEDSRGYLVLEFVEGPSLKELVEKEGAQPLSTVISVGKDLSAALLYLHGRFPAVVHRDLSPDNVILREDGSACIVDFNVARELERDSRTAVVGKQAYMPPEQFRGKPCPQSDLYALGATLYFLAVGQDPPPLTNLSPFEDAAEARSKDPGFAEFDEIVRGLTRLNLEKRIRSADLVYEKLSRLALKRRES